MGNNRCAVVVTRHAAERFIERVVLISVWRLTGDRCRGVRRLTA